MSSFRSSYYYHEEEEEEVHEVMEEEVAENEIEIHRTIHHILEEIINDDNANSAKDTTAEFSQMPIDQMPIDEVPIDEVPFDKMPMGQTPIDQMPMGQLKAEYGGSQGSLMTSSQSAQMELSSEDGIVTSSSSSSSMDDQQHKLGTVAGSASALSLQFPILLPIRPQQQQPQFLPSRNSRQMQHHQHDSINKRTMPEAIEMGQIPKKELKPPTQKWRPRIGGAGAQQRVGPIEATGQGQQPNKMMAQLPPHIIIDGIDENEPKRRGLSGPQRALFLFSAMLLFLIFSSILVWLILFWFNPNRKL